MQSRPTRPSHHANASRSLFQNPWTQTTVEPSPSSMPSLPESHDSDSDASSAPDAPSSSVSPSSPVTVPGPSVPARPYSFEAPEHGKHKRVRALAPRPPHPPIKVVKPDWGRGSLSGATLKATGLGHASFLVEFPSYTAADEPPRVLFVPIFSDSAGPSPWIGVQRHLLPLCTVAELPLPSRDLLA